MSTIIFEITKDVYITFKESEKKLNINEILKQCTFDEDEEEYLEFVVETN
jgi:hypothetical protein